MALDIFPIFRDNAIEHQILKICSSRYYLGFLIYLILFSGCEKWDLERVSFIQVRTVGSDEVGVTNAFMIGGLDNPRGLPVDEVGFVLSPSKSSEEDLKLNGSDVLTL